MRFDKRKIHRSLFTATDKYSSRLMWGQGGWSGDETKIVAAHQGVWWKENGGKLLIGFLLWLSLIIALLALKSFVEKPVMVAATFAWMFLGLGSLIWGISREKTNLSVEELKVLLPILELTPVQRAYAECLLAMEGIGMSEDEKNDLLRQLNVLLDEEERLLSIRAHGASFKEMRDSIVREHAELTLKVESVIDPTAKQAFQKSLEICERRLAAAEDLALSDERVEAQLEMIRQAMCGVKDSLQRLRVTPSASLSELNLDQLNESVSLAHRQSAALEAAVAEVRAISQA